jgi:hypothetical protein
VRLPDQPWLPLISKAGNFFVPALTGNILGGVSLVAALAQGQGG